MENNSIKSMEIFQKNRLTFRRFYFLFYICVKITHIMNDVRLNSILDNDFYKITMQNAVVKLFPSSIVKYEFINRGKHHFPEGFDVALREAVNKMAELKLTKDEKKFMARTCPYIDLPYLDFLEGYHYDPSEVKIHQREVIFLLLLKDCGTEPSFGKFRCSP